MRQKSFYFYTKIPRAITAEIFQAHYFSFYWPYEIFNRINLKFGITLVALALTLLRKIKIKLPITAENFSTIYSMKSTKAKSKS